MLDLYFTNLSFSCFLIKYLFPHVAGYQAFNAPPASFNPGQPPTGQFGAKDGANFNRFDNSNRQPGNRFGNNDGKFILLEIFYVHFIKSVVVESFVYIVINFEHSEEFF